MRRALLTLALSLCMFGSWACRAPMDGPLSCVADAGCPGGYHCGTAGVCVADVPCHADTDCCLAQRCTHGRCRRRTMCSQSAPCGEPASRCLHGMCVPMTCATAADCPASVACTMGTCRKQTPCQGYCGADQLCAALLDRCVLRRAPNEGPLCQPGQLAVLGNEEAHLLEGCSGVAQQAVCAALPPLPAGDLGWPSILLDRGDHLALIARDRTYGDIILARHGRAPPYDRISITPLAGVPLAAPVLGDPQGPRAGIAAPGPDVGRVFDAQVGADGDLHVVWRDDSADALVYLRQTEGTVGVPRTIASGGGVGAAISLDLQPDGAPMVAAFSPAPAGGGMAALHLFSAMKSSPLSPADWQAKLITQQVVAAPALPCAGACAASEACVWQDVADPAAGDHCVVPATGCLPCLPSQACSAGICRQLHLPAPPLDHLPDGRGVHLDLLRLADGPHIAAYSSSAGNLAFFQPQPDGGHKMTVVGGGQIPGGSADVGRFVRLLPAPGGGVEAYCQDVSGGRLLRIRPGPPLELVMVDDGIRSDGHHRVGADVAAADTDGGAVVLAYQDTRRGHAVIAALGKDGKLGARVDLTSAGAGGFTPTVVQLGSKALVVSAASLRFDGKANLRTTVELRSVVMSGL